MRLYQGFLFTQSFVWRDVSTTETLIWKTDLKMHVIIDADIYYVGLRLRLSASYQFVAPRHFDRLHTSEGALSGGVG